MMFKVGISKDSDQVEIQVGERDGTTVTVIMNPDTAKFYSELIFNAANFTQQTLNSKVIE